jgi:hypothetical protein
MYGVYQYEIYDLFGDITQPGYRYKFISKENLIGQYNNQVREEVKRIYEILND